MSPSQKSEYPTLIHERVALAREGRNPTVIGRLRSGWAVLGDDQRLRGYCLLLSDPVADNLNALDGDARRQFLMDMAAIGDALMQVVRPSIVNYAIFGNTDRALHAHIHPRYDSEPPEKRRTVPFVYHMEGMPYEPFEPERDQPLMAQLRECLRAAGMLMVER